MFFGSNLVRDLHYILPLLIPKPYKLFYSVFTGFTIHFATINTLLEKQYLVDYASFTIHFATINTYCVVELERRISDLQYTLLLLIRTAVWSAATSNPHLQYTLLLLILPSFFAKCLAKVYLQYTLLLLIQPWAPDGKNFSDIYNTLCYY